MPHKIDNGPEGPIQLGGYSVLEADGPDAASFLQAQCMNDVMALAVGHWQWNGWLSPKGRVIALFALFRAADARFLLALPDFPAEELRLQLQRFVFRSKVRLAADTPWRVAGAFGGGPPTDGTWRLDLHDEARPRELWLLPADAALPDAASAEQDAHWLACDIAQGFPRLGVEQRERWTPQMLSLERFSAFSLKKGCYPGQEIVARTHYLGQAKRGLVRVAGADLRPGGVLASEAGGPAIGEIVCATADGREALAVISLDKVGSGLCCGAASVARIPLAGTPPA